jgi:hypothetical protein
VVCVIGVLELGQVLRFTTLNAMETKHEYFIITVSEYYCNIDKNDSVPVSVPDLKCWGCVVTGVMF